MVIVVASGFLGRYLYTLVPAAVEGVELEELDHERAFQRVRPRLTFPMARDRFASCRSSAPGAGRRGVSQRVARAVVVDLPGHRRIPSTIARRGRLKQLGVDRRTRRDLARRAARMIVIARRQVVAPKAQDALALMEKVHVPFTVSSPDSRGSHLVSWSRAW